MRFLLVLPLLLAPAAVLHAAARITLCRRSLKPATLPIFEHAQYPMTEMKGLETLNGQSERLNGHFVPPMTSADAQQVYALAQDRLTHPEAHLAVYRTLKRHIAETKAHARWASVTAHTYSSQLAFNRPARELVPKLRQRATDATKRIAELEKPAVPHFGAWNRALITHISKAQERLSQGVPLPDAEPVAGSFGGHDLPWMTSREAQQLDTIAAPGSGVAPEYVHSYVARLALHRGLEYESALKEAQGLRRALETPDGHVLPEHEEEHAALFDKEREFAGIMSHHSAVHRAHFDLAARPNSRSRA